MLDSSVVFVDLETTGASPLRDRIIEVGIVKVTDGRLEYEWQSLVNPGISIPPVIQSFTGITDEMVRDAPSFAQIADELLRHLEGSLFVAHNARFDHGFLRQEFQRLDMPFRPPVLCTVKLSRALYPEHHRHGLDAIIARHGLVCRARHRALGDARVLWDFVRQAQGEKSPEIIRAAVEKATRRMVLPGALQHEAIDAVPDGPGVYLLYGENDALLHIGRGTTLRNRVQSHFTSGGKKSRFAQTVRRIDWVETAGELGASLKEAELLRRLRPAHNRRPEEGCCSVCIRVSAGASEPATEIVDAIDITPSVVGLLHGLFRTRREARRALRGIAQAHGLCARRLGLESAGGPCSMHQNGGCAVCRGRESAEHHDLRLRAALATLKLKNWPYPGPIGVREHDSYTGRTEFHLFDSWCHLGTARDEAELYETLATRMEAAFDPQVYRMLVRYFIQHRPQVIRLDSSSTISVA